MQLGDMYRYSFPPGDLQVTVGGVTLKPALALGSWVAFKRMAGTKGEAIAMGIVLGRGGLVDFTMIVIALGTFGVLWRGWKVPEPLLILAAGALGLLLAGTQS